MRDASAVFFLSEAYRKQVFEHYLPRRYWDEISRKTHIIPNGIDDFWLENSVTSTPAFDSKKKIKLVYAGRIDRNKNIPAIQNAVQILHRKGIDCLLTVVGKVVDQGEFELIKKDSNTTYVAALPKEKLIDVYRNHHIFVMPSHTESFGLVYAEAMSQGLPVVYTRGQGFDGQFPEGQAGYGVRDDDPRSIAEGIERIVREYSSFRDLSQKVRKFRWSQITERYADIYRCLLNERILDDTGV